MLMRASTTPNQTWAPYKCFNSHSMFLKTCNGINVSTRLKQRKLSKKWAMGTRRRLWPPTTCRPQLVRKLPWARVVKRPSSVKAPLKNKSLPLNGRNHPNKTRADLSSSQVKSKSLVTHRLPNIKVATRATQDSFRSKNRKARLLKAQSRSWLTC